ncbi:GNAT family N-acetyltransferase [Alteripontixanthobacter maritimus]|uniref:GNAT family N-acetyltransferase n=1 Tax=Alteripontixanthobacter maritimus TaxID=2161824 RepID=UPI001E659025|nr:GNAT family N-acetyltransferase [Alteripontixanthobacter maritimus]
MRDNVDAAMTVMEAAFDPHWGEAWTRRQLCDSLLLPNTRMLLVDSGGVVGTDIRGLSDDIAGFALIRSANVEQELLLIAIHPDFRGKGLGGRMLETFITDARQSGADSVFLEMRYNNPAQALYKQHGFEPIGRREGYYRLTNGERIDAVTFARKIKD